eukprot:SAG11_NODE_173_length_13507_cov_10.489931_10_plen_251_part_00
MPPLRLMLLGLLLQLTHGAVKVNPLYKVGGVAAEHPDYIRAGKSLMAACGRGGAVAEVERLLADGADPNFVDDAAMMPGHKHAHSPLLQAVAAGSLAKAKLLLDAGAEVSSSARNGNKPLVQAVQNGYHDIAAALLDAGAPVDGMHDGTMQSPLMIAANKGHVQLLELLLARGADVNYALADGANALHFSAQSHKPEAVAVLLRHADHQSLTAQWRNVHGKMGTPAEHTTSRDIKTMMADAHSRLKDEVR